MTDIPVDWQCPHCDQLNTNYRNVDEVCLCLGLDCFDEHGKRFVASWDFIDRKAFLEERTLQEENK